MQRMIPLALAWAMNMCGCVHAQSPPPATSESTPIEQRDASIDQLLDVMEKRGQDLRTLSAGVRLTNTDTALGDATMRSGKFALEIRENGSTRAHILFDRKEADGRAIVEKIEYQLDGDKLVDRNFSKRTQVTRFVLRPGEKMNLLKLGEGPFPLPIGQKREDIYAQFEVEKIAPSNEDPANTAHLRLTPKPTTSLARKFKTVDVWVNPEDGMPVRIETLDRNETATTTTDLSNMKVNSPLTDADLALEKIDESNWNLTEESFRDGNATPPRRGR